MASPAQTIVTQDPGYGSVLGGAAAGIFCFAAGTEVPMEDGVMTIENISAGMKTWDRNDEAQEIYDTLEPVIQETYTVITDTGRSVTTTMTQPFDTKIGWVELRSLKKGSEILTADGFEAIDKIIPAGKQLVYDLKVRGENVYYANGFLAKGGSSEWA